MKNNWLFLVIIFILSSSCNTTTGPTTTVSTTKVSVEKEKVENRGANKEKWWDNLPRAGWKEFQKLKTPSNWFEVYQITSNIIAIYEPGQFEEVISYLIIGEQKALLWDTGTGIGDIRKVVDHLTDKEIMVLNSHTHYDHVGGNYQFENIYNFDTPFTRKNALGKTSAIAKEFISGDWLWKPTPPAFSKERYEIKPFKTSQFIANKEYIDLGGIRLQVLHTPGHTPDAICLLDESNRLLFTGDTFYPAPLYAHFGESNVDTYLRTAIYLASLQSKIDHLLPSHNEPWLPSTYLLKMSSAFQQIKKGEGEYVETDGTKEYFFDGFSVIVK